MADNGSITLPDVTLEELRTASEVRITREELSYEPHKPVSYVRDLAMAEIRGDLTAKARLERHAEEMRVELPAFEQRARQATGGMELRVNPNRLAREGGYFAPPLWINEHFATAPRPKRVFAGLVPTLPLPTGVQSVKLPRLTTGTDTQEVSDLEAVRSQDIIDAASESPAMTIAGQVDASLQLYEQSPAGAHLDWAVFKDLTESYDAELEGYLINGSGVNGQFYGLLNLASGAGGRNAVAYTDASPTGAEMFTALGKVAAQLGDARLLPPECWLMRTARWAWLGSAETTEGLPLAVPGHQPPNFIPNVWNDEKPSPGPAILGWLSFYDDAIPANLGAGANQDAIIACRPTDSLLLETSHRTSVGTEVLSGTLQVRFQLHGFAAAIHRYPTGVATLTGTGCIVQSEF
jgi:HK97 family phage major capsid protein